MADVAETIKLYYDFKSPFTYLAMEPAYWLEETHRVRLRFIPLELAVREAYGGDLEQRAQRDWDKVRYLYMDVRRFANERGHNHPRPAKDFRLAARADERALCGSPRALPSVRDRVFERFFKRELNIEDFDALAAVMRKSASMPRASGITRRAMAPAICEPRPPKPSATGCSAYPLSSSRASSFGATIASNG